MAGRLYLSSHQLVRPLLAVDREPGEAGADVPWEKSFRVFRTTFARLLVVLLFSKFSAINARADVFEWPPRAFSLRTKRRYVWLFTPVEVFKQVHHLPLPRQCVRQNHNAQQQQQQQRSQPHAKPRHSPLLLLGHLPEGSPPPRRPRGPATT